MSKDNTFSRAHRRSAAAMGITPEELADRQRRNRERRRQERAAKLAAKALAAGVSVAEMRERIKANKAAARAAQQAADRRRELMDEAQILLAEAEWRGALIPPADRDALRAVTSRKGFRGMGKEAAVAAIKRVSDMIHVLAVANARRILDVAMGKRRRFNECHSHREVEVPSRLT